MTWHGSDGLLKDSLSMILVGALWGCTNPLLRKGSVEVEERSRIKHKESRLLASLNSFLNVRVWLPYVLNQSGSIVFYILLANSKLSLAVPICNALALLFSFLTSLVLGEPIQKPFRSFLGASLVVVGVTVCVSTTWILLLWFDRGRQVLDRSNLINAVHSCQVETFVLLLLFVLDSMTSFEKTRAGANENPSHDCYFRGFKITTIRCNCQKSQQRRFGSDHIQSCRTNTRKRIIKCVKLPQQNSAVR